MVKKPKIKHTTLISDYTNGGLKDTDINCKLCSFKFSWITTLLDKSNFHPWKVIANEIVRPVGGCDIFHKVYFVIRNQKRNPKSSFIL